MIRRSVVLLCLLLAVRLAAAADAPTPQPEPDKQLAERIRALIVQLGDDKYDVREAATAQLRRIGRPALPALEAATKDPDLERANRAAGLAGRIRTMAARDPAKINKNATNGYMSVHDNVKQMQTFKVDADTAADSVRFRVARTINVPTADLTVELREFGNDKAEPLFSYDAPANWVDDKGNSKGVTRFFAWFEIKKDVKLVKGKTYALVFSSPGSGEDNAWLINCFYRDTFPGGKHLCDEGGKSEALGEYDLAIELRAKQEVTLTTVDQKTDLPALQEYGFGHDGEDLRKPDAPPPNAPAAN